MQFKISIYKGSFFDCANNIKQSGCIQERYFEIIKINKLNTTFSMFIFFIKEVVLMNQMPPDT